MLNVRELGIRPDGLLSSRSQAPMMARKPKQSFENVLNEKTTVEPQDTGAGETEKLNEKETIRQEVRSAKKPVKATKEDQVDNEKLAGETNEVKEVDETFEKVKKLLTKLGLTDEEAVELMEMIPPEMMENLEAMLVKLDAGAMEVHPEALQVEMVNILEKVEVFLETAIKNMEQVQGDQAISIEQVEHLLQKVETAQQEVVQATPEAFSDMLESVQTTNQQQPMEAKSQGKVDKDQTQAVETSDTQVKETTSASEVKPVEAVKPTNQVAADKPSDGPSKEVDGQVTKAEAGSTDAGDQMVKDSAGEQVDVLKFENTLIKSAEVSATAETTRPQMSQKIMEQVVNGTRLQLNVTEQGSEMLIKLKPADLGNVELKVSIHKGVLMAEIQVENQTVKEALESNLSDLKNALDDKGYSIEGMEVNVRQDSNPEDQSFEERFFGMRKQKKSGVFSLDNAESVSLESINRSLAGMNSTIEYLG